MGGPDYSAVPPSLCLRDAVVTAPWHGVLEPALSTTDASTASLRLARLRAGVQVRPESRAPVDIRPERLGGIDVGAESRAVIEIPTKAAWWPGRSFLGFVDSQWAPPQLGAVEPRNGCRDDRRVAELHEREPARPPRRAVDG